MYLGAEQTNKTSLAEGGLCERASCETMGALQDVSRFTCSSPRGSAPPSAAQWWVGEPHGVTQAGTHLGVAGHLWGALVQVELPTKCREKSLEGGMAPSCTPAALLAPAHASLCRGKVGVLYTQTGAEEGKLGAQ